MIKPKKSNIIYLFVLVGSIVLFSLLYNGVYERFASVFNVRVIVIFRICLLFIMGIILGLNVLLKERSKEGSWAIRLEFLLLSIVLLFMSISRFFNSGILLGLNFSLIFNLSLLVLTSEVISGYLFCISFVKR